MINPPLWKASIALTKQDAADVSAVLELEGSAQAVLIVEEPFADGAVVEALYTEAPDAAYLSRIVGREIRVAPLPDQDWIRLSQEGLPPVRAGRFFVYGAHDAGTVPHGVIPMKIEAGLAFGTGHHETTARQCTRQWRGAAGHRRHRRRLDQPAAGQRRAL
jgi:ribosomal protein L11 methyltransferase